MSVYSDGGKCPNCGGESFKVDAVVSATDYISFKDGEWDVDDSRYFDGGFLETGSTICSACGKMFTYKEFWGETK